MSSSAFPGLEKNKTSPIITIEEVKTPEHEQVKLHVEDNVKEEQQDSRDSMSKAIRCREMVILLDMSLTVVATLTLFVRMGIQPHWWICSQPRGLAFLDAILAFCAYRYCAFAIDVWAMNAGADLEARRQWASIGQTIITYTFWWSAIFAVANKSTAATYCAVS